MKILIAIPSGDHLDVEFVKSLLALKPVGRIDIQIYESSLVYLGREKLSSYANMMEFDYILWLDTDMVFEPAILERLIADDKPVVGGLFFTRRPPYMPAYWTKVRLGSEEEREAVQMDKWPEDELIEVDACGMAAVLMKGQVLRDVIERYGTAFQPLPGYGEDLSFCIRARNCGHTIWCDPRVKVGHRGMTIVTEETFKAYREILIKRGEA